ncbi:MAG: DNA mismatch repair endonuclease MutL [Muribaculaceae bacterium]|nr:DNA mismatch repair endonuclease MutL [Muribaculaceae bacterium]
MAVDIIRQLPDGVANQIAAGEVIQRPASVIKELVENAVDAGATSIQIILKDAGRTLIQVVDNGCGMTPTDARMAFEHHATSKISSAEDLYSLRTMGFRGEALPSIAAVAQIEMRTMPRGETVGSRLVIANSIVETQEPVACAAGTNIMVKNLFAYLPVRRKFLKKDSVELSFIMKEFERLALVNTGIEFSIIHNDTLLHQLLPGTLRQRIGALFGHSLEKQIIPVETQTGMVNISGFVSLPQFARKRGSQNFFFVNGRNMQHKYFRKAVLSCYEKLIAPDTEPSFFINFDVDPARIDVNVHPQKYEIKFVDEQAIWQILAAALREALGKCNASGGMDFDISEAPEIPIFNPDASAGMPPVQKHENYNPFDVEKTSISKRQSVANWDALYENFNKEGSGTIGRTDSRLNEIEPDLKEDLALIPGLDNAPSGGTQDITTQNVLQLHQRYLITTGRSGIMIIDRFRAQVRVLYEKFISRLKAADISTQQLIFPDSVTLSASENIVLEASAEALQQLGFDLSYLGDCTWAINGIPSMLKQADPAETLRTISTALTGLQDLNNIATENILQPVALAMARTASTRPGQNMPMAEAESLFTALIQLTEANYTPDGLSIIKNITDEELENLFA